MVSVLEIAKKWRHRHPVFFWILAFLLGFFLFIFSFYLSIAYLLPLPDPFQDFQDSPTTKIYDRNGVLLYEVLQPELGKKTFIPLKEIPQTLLDATLAAEDIHYYSHPGVDVLAIARALFFNVREQRIVSGASTITQQLVRNMLGTQNRDIWDKGLEALYAIRLSHTYSKDEILELYINTIYYGNLSYGAEAAAQNYFGQHIYDLDTAQITFIAGLPQSPSRYNPYISFESAKKRQKYVLGQMVKHGFLSQEEADAVYEENLKLQANKHSIKAPHFVNEVLNELESQFGAEYVHRAGLRITTTLDYNMQIEAESTIDRHIASLDRHNVTNGALIALDVSSGQVLAWVGSADYFSDEIDGAVDIATSLRQPGSSIKPFTYLLSFEKGYTPANILYDIPTQFSTATGPYTPKNYDLEFHGPVRVRTALASSYNIPAVKTLEYVGIGDFISFLRDLGIQTLTDSADHYGLALTLGGGEVRLIDMAQAYHVLANYGSKIDYSTVLSIENQEKEILYSWNTPVSQFILGPHGKEHAYLIIDILKDPNARIPGFGDGNVLELSHEAAVKTGTTRNFRDNWTIGFTPQLLSAVWVGNADASPMENISGAEGAAPIWADFMEAALESSPEYTFEVPRGITEVEICALSGQLPTEYCLDRVFEKFSRDNLPTEYDEYHQLFTLNTQTGLIIPEVCNNQYSSHTLAQKVLVAYPPGLQKWAVSKGLQLPQFAQCTASSEYTGAYTYDYSNEEANAVFIDHPINNDEFILDSTLPLQDQKVPLRVSAPYTTTEVKFFMNDAHVGTQKELPYSFLWPPERGRHTFFAEVLLSDGRTIQSSKVSFTIL